MEQTNHRLDSDSNIQHRPGVVLVRIQWRERAASPGVL